MHRTKKFFISLFLVLIFIFLFQTNLAKYVIEDTYVVAKLDIDRTKPNIEFMYFTSSNISYANCTNKMNLLTIYFKITEKNILKNSLYAENIKVMVNHEYIIPTSRNLSLISENLTEKVYAFSFTKITSNNSLTIIIPKGIIQDQSGLINEDTYFSIDV